MSSGVVKLRLVNRGRDAATSDIVLFQRNMTPGDTDFVVAWRVIRNLGAGDDYPFEFPLTLTVAASDSYGNYTPQLPIAPGQAVQMQLSAAGDILRPYAPGSGHPARIDVRNDLELGAIDGHIFRDHKLLATASSIAPGEKATFSVDAKLWIAALWHVEEGSVMNSAMTSESATALNLTGVQSADILMTGGPSRTGSKPYEFTLTNVRSANAQAGSAAGSAPA